MAKPNGKNAVNYRELYNDVLEEKQDITRALIAVVLSVGGSLEVSDDVLMSIDKTDRVLAESSPDSNTHRVWVERTGGTPS